MTPTRDQIKKIHREGVRAQVLQHVTKEVWNQIWDAVAEGIWDQMLIAEDIEGICGITWDGTTKSARNDSENASNKTNLTVN